MSDSRSAIASLHASPHLAKRDKSEKKSRLAKPEAAEPEQLSLPGFE